MRFALVDSPEESYYRRLYELSVRDPLTHVFNRTYMQDRLVAEVSAHRATGDLTVFLLDLDHFKEVNDRFGHMAGDRALCKIARRIVHILRAKDILARYGGDEFVVVASGSGGDEAGELAGRVLRAVEGLHVAARGGTLRITASIGMASLAEVASSDEPVHAILSLADERMYAAKARGGNRVCGSAASQLTLPLA
jgi:diguanylate cyclase (GGDEF)-like protein